MHAVYVHTAPHRHVLAFAFLAACASSQFAAAQPASPQVPQNCSYQDTVVVENGGGINGAMREPVMGFIARRMMAQAKAESGREYPYPSYVEFLPQSSADEDLPRRVYYLKVMWVAESYSEADGKRFWEAARQEVEKRLRVVQKQTHEARVEQWITQEQRIQNDYGNARAQLQEITNKMKIQGDGAAIEQAREDLHEILTQGQQLQLQLVGIQARREAIEARIDELREVAAKEIADDPILREMQSLVEIQERRLSVIQPTKDMLNAQRSILELKQALSDYEKYSTSDLERDAQIARLKEQLQKQQDLLDQFTAHAMADAPNTPGYQLVRADLIEARIALLKAQRDAADRVQGSVLTELNNELSSLIIETAEIKEKLKVLSSLIEDLKNTASPDNVADVELLERERSDAQDAVSNLRKQLHDHEGDRPGDLEQITIRPLEAALFGDDAEAADAEEPAAAAEASQ